MFEDDDDDKLEGDNLPEPAENDAGEDASEEEPALSAGAAGDSTTEEEPQEDEEDRDVLLISGRIRTTLEELGMSQNSLAKAVGRQPGYLSLLLSGQRPWRSEVLMEIAAELGMEHSELVEGTSLELGCTASEREQKLLETLSESITELTSQRAANLAQRMELDALREQAQISEERAEAADKLEKERDAEKTKNARLNALLLAEQQTQTELRSRLQQAEFAIRARESALRQQAQELRTQKEVIDALRRRLSDAQQGQLLAGVLAGLGGAILGAVASGD